MARKETWVIKAGSHVICNGGPLLVQDWMNQVSLLKKKQNLNIVWVTSGAISSAKDITGFNIPVPTLAQKQALSAVGQPVIMETYNRALHFNGLTGAQILLSASDMSNGTKKKNFLNSIRELFKLKTVPIINENDAVTTDEIQFGDNDHLSVEVAKVLKAKKLIILSNVDGLFEKDPKKYKNAQLVTQIQSITPQILKMAPKGSKSSQGSGGMYSKLLAAKSARLKGITTLIVNGSQPKVLINISKGKCPGTIICP